MKLYYEDGKIRDKHSYKEYNCDDDTDLKILCNDVNTLLVDLELDCKVLNDKIWAIKRCVE